MLAGRGRIILVGRRKAMSSSSVPRVYPSTPVRIAGNRPFEIDRFETSVILIGSCFSSNIGECLKCRKFKVHLNPQGIQFNPISIAKTIENLIDRRVWTRADLCEGPAIAKDIDLDDYCAEADVLYSYQHHSSYTSLKAEEEQMLRRMNSDIATGAAALASPKAVLYVTLGTSKVYTRLETEEIVSNCHKNPQSEFKSRFLSSNETFIILNNVCKNALDYNECLKIVFTVSPVRHTREGAIANSMSKASLLTAVHELVALYPNSISYFPSYEIMMDELRDYRWYEPDMVHPSRAAIDYMFRIFEEFFMSADTISLSNQILQLQRDVIHRPLLPFSRAHQRHLLETRNRIVKLQDKYRRLNGGTAPLLDFSEELSLIGHMWKGSDVIEATRPQ